MPAKRRTATGSGSTSKGRASKLAKEHNLSASEEAEIKEAFAMFSVPKEGEREGVMATTDVRRALIALNIPPSSPSELGDIISVLDPDGEGYATYPPFVAVCALKLHTRDTTDDAHAREVEEAFLLFTEGSQGPITMTSLKRVAQLLNEDCKEELLKDMLREAGGPTALRTGVGKDEFEDVMRRAGVWR